MDEHQKLIDKIMPYRMQSASILNLALRYVIELDAPKPMKVYFRDKLCIEGLSTGFTNSAIEAGIVHCRSILEFLGIKGDPSNRSKLVTRNSKRKDDLAVEDFSGRDGQLSKITIQEAVSPYQGETDEAEAALSRLIYIANKGIAHFTLGPIEDPEDIRLLEIASRGVPSLAVNYFYTRMGLPAPAYEISGRKRNEE